MTNTPQNCKGHGKQRKTEKLSHTRGDQGDRTTKCKWHPGWDLGIKKRDINEKSGEIQIMSGMYFIVIISVF